MTAPEQPQDLPEPINGHDSSPDLTGPIGRRPNVRRSVMGRLWAVGVAFAAVLLVLLVFILQNGQRAEVSFLGAHGHLPMGVALLLSAVFGILLVALPGTARIMQLRMLNRRNTTAQASERPAPLRFTAGRRTG
jgi:uncharacterized integral membrane protein